MTERTYRRRFHDEYNCPRCFATYEGSAKGKCLCCGWLDQSQSRRGLAPNENSKNDATTKARRHHLKRIRKASNVGG